MEPIGCEPWFKFSCPNCLKNNWLSENEWDYITHIKCWKCKNEFPIVDDEEIKLSGKEVGGGISNLG